MLKLAAVIILVGITVMLLMCSYYELNIIENDLNVDGEQSYD